jgi:UDP-N-acetylglucosamine 3-dehydrogenase
VSRRHLYGYLKTGKASIVAASDTESKRRERAQRRWKIAKVYGDFQDMLNQEQLDMVSVCVPPRFHRQAVLAAAHAGAKAVLCEKPIGLDLREADEMIRVCREHGVILAIGHQRRFGAQHRRAKQLLKEGAVGEIRHVVAQCPPDILRAGIHCADMLLDYVGPIARVSASLSDSHGGKARSPQDACFSTQSRDEDSWIFVEFTNGLQATVRVDDRSPLDAKLTFIGEKGAIQVWWDGGLRYRSSQDNVWTVPALELNPYLDEFYFEIDSILRALTSKTALEIPGEAGRNSLEVILAILIANQEGRSVSLPLANTAGAQSKVDST